MQPCSSDSRNKSLCCGHYIFGNTFFIIPFLVSVADCGYVHLFCSYLSKNESVKLSFTLLMFFYNTPFADHLGEKDIHFLEV